MALCPYCLSPSQKKPLVLFCSSGLGKRLLLCPGLWLMKICAAFVARFSTPSAFSPRLLFTLCLNLVFIEVVEAGGAGGEQVHPLPCPPWISAPQSGPQHALPPLCLGAHMAAPGPSLASRNRIGVFEGDKGQKETRRLPKPVPLGCCIPALG